MSTTQDIINQAILRSQKNQPEWAANYATELLALMQRTLTLCYQMGHLVAPDRYAVDVAIVGSASTWNLANLADGPIWFVETAAGVPVKIVAAQERTLDIGVGRLYHYNAGVYKVKSVGAAIDPTASETLTFWSLLYPQVLTTITTPFDYLWPTAFDGLLVEEMALYFAQKDVRTDEYAMLQASRDKWLQAFVQSLRMHNLALSRRFQTALAPGMLPGIAAGFLGGAEVK